MAAPASGSANVPANGPINGVDADPSRLVLVHLTGTREDGTSFLGRSWAHVTYIRRAGVLERLDIEVLQDAVYGSAFGRATEEEWDRIRNRRAELEVEERRVERAEEQRRWRERIEDARAVVEEWGLPALHLQRVAGERRSSGRKRSRADNGDDEEAQRSRRRTEAPSEDDGSGEEVLRAHQRRRMDDGGDSGAGPSLAGWAHDGHDDGAEPSLAGGWDPNHDDDSD